MNDNENINMENKKHIEKTYVDKAINLLKACIGIFIFSLITYLIGIFLYDAFDFGLIFEIISFIFIIKAINSLEKNNLELGKRDIIIGMIPFGWLIIYDFIQLIVNLDEVIPEVISYYASMDFLFYNIEPYLFDVTLVISITLLYRAYSSICKADGSKKTNDYVENFYDKL